MNGGDNNLFEHILCALCNTHNRISSLDDLISQLCVISSEIRGNQEDIAMNREFHCEILDALIKLDGIGFVVLHSNDTVLITPMGIIEISHRFLN